jgi:hypothetical protein
MIRVVHPGSRILMLTFSHPGSRIQGSKRYPIPDPGSGSATLQLKIYFLEKFGIKFYYASVISVCSTLS